MVQNPFLNDTRSFITVIIKARHCTLSSVSSMQNLFSKLHFNIIL